MSARFWLKPTSVPLCLQDVIELTEEEAHLWLAEMRWGSNTEQVCPDWVLSLTNFSYSEVVEDLTRSLSGSIWLNKPEDASLKSIQRKRR